MKKKSTEENILRRLHQKEVAFAKKVKASKKRKVIQKASRKRNRQ